MSRRTLLLLIITVLVLLVLPVGCSRQTSTSRSVAPNKATGATCPTEGGAGSGVLAVGTKAPDFTLKTLDGKAFKLSSCFGKPGSVVVLDLWATWCPPCRKVIPNLVKLNETFRGKAVRIVGVALDEEKSVVDKFVKNNQVSYTVCLDFGGSVLSKPYKIEGIPVLYFIDKNGVIRNVEVGFPGDKDAQAKKVKQWNDIVVRLLGEK